MSYPGRNNSKISNRPSGGGNKKQGLAPKATFFFKAPFTGNKYSINSGDGRDRFKLVCMNQLGGVGAGGIPGRSYAFAPGADGRHNHFYCGHPFGFKYKNNKHIIYPKNNI
jgi:hypothetical protein